MSHNDEYQHEEPEDHVNEPLFGGLDPEAVNAMYRIRSLLDDVNSETVILMDRMQDNTNFMNDYADLNAILCMVEKSQETAEYLCEHAQEDLDEGENDDTSSDN